MIKLDFNLIGKDMTIVSEVEVLTILENRRQSLFNELQRVEKALSILKGGANKDSPLTPKKSIKSQTRLKVPRQKLFTIPTTYDKTQKWDEKVLLVLSQNQKSFKEDIAKEIQKLEPSTNEQKILNLISVKLSALLKAGAITAEKEGRRFKYSIL